jgi:Flp pilus assembly secretin CpaC
MSLVSRLAVALALTLALGLTTAAPAQEGAINVTVSMARILRISAPAATVIIGNPAVADVTIQDPQTLVLTGKSYGRTNMIVLDNAGNPIADTIIEVVQGTDTLTVYMGTQRNSMACAPVCQNTITLGDDPAFTGSAISSSQQIQGAAQ